MSEKSSLDNVFKWIILVVLAIVALKVALTVVGIASFLIFSLGGFLLFKVVPLVLIVWLVIKAVEWFRGKNGGAGSSEPAI